MSNKKGKASSKKNITSKKKKKISSPPEVKKESSILDALPEQYVDQLISQLEERYKVENYTDVFKATQEIRALENSFDKALDEAKTKGYPLVNTSTALLGYEAAGSTLRKLYPNPFAVYSFIGNNHWATLLARMKFREDLSRDGYVIVAPERTSKRELKAVQHLFDDIGLDNLRLTIADHLNVYGNCWIDRKHNILGGLMGLQPLLPERVLPILNNYGDFVIGWEYVVGGIRLYFPLDGLDHLKTYNLRSYQLGNPSLAPVVVDVEADMYAAVYANMMFQKGGLVRAIVSLGDTKDAPDDVTVLNENSGLHFAQKIYELFSRQYSGVRGANQLTFLPNVKNVFPITSPKDLEGPYKETSDRTAMKVGMLLGIPPRRLGIHTTTQYENKMAVEDAEALDSDNHRYYITNIVDKYINDKIIKEMLGIQNVEIKFSGEYTSMSINAAELGYKISQMGTNVMRVDEFRVKCLHWEPLGGEEGEAWIGGIKNDALTSDSDSKRIAAEAAETAANKPPASSKELEYRLEKLVGPKDPMFKQSFGEKIIKYKPQDIRLL